MGGDTFLLYCPHQEDYEQMLCEFMAEVFEEKETADRVSLRFGIFEDAMQEPDIEERFIRAQAAADSIKGNPQKKCGFYEFDKK
jgi:GGDEF domain-containing protein